MSFLRIIQSQLSFVCECSRIKKLLKNLNDSMKTAHDLIEYLDHVTASLNADYISVYDSTRALLQDDRLTKKQQIDLQWGLAHLHTQFELTTLAIKAHQKGLETIASKPIQD